MQVGGYEVRGELGRGGMGVVYRAFDPALAREVAIKVVAERPGPEEVARLRREGQAAARLHHPNIVAVHGLGEHAGRPYLVMDLVEGEDLAARLRRQGPLAPREAAGLAASLARALDYAHRQGVVHRDLKPQNVIIDREGEPRLVDFGLSRVVDRQSLTATGEVLGTPGYMAPEQANGERVGPPADVYGLGATLYALLTGRPPIEGRSTLDVLRAVLEEAPAPPQALRPGLDPALGALCLRCLEKAPAARFASARDLAEALEAWLRGPHRARRRRGGAALGAALGGVLGAAGALAWAVPAVGAARAEATRARADASAAARERDEARAGERAAGRERDAARAERDDGAAALVRARRRIDVERRAAFALARGQHQDAIDALTRSLEDDPDAQALTLRAHARRAGIEARRTERDPAAEADVHADLEAALARDPGCLPARLLKARLALHHGGADASRAVRGLLDDLEAQEPHDRAELLALGAWASLRERDPDRARSLAEEALALWPGHPHALLARASARYLRPDAVRADLDAALADLLPALYQEPRDARVWTALGEVWLAAGSHDRARIHFDVVVNVFGSPEPVTARRLADLYAAEGALTAALGLRERLEGRGVPATGEEELAAGDWCLELGRLTAAVERYQRAGLRDPALAKAALSAAALASALRRDVGAPPVGALDAADLRTRCARAERLGDDPAALPAWLEVVDATDGASKPPVVLVRRLAMLKAARRLLEGGRSDQALRLLVGALREGLPPAHPWFGETLKLMGEALDRG
ncbi:MAG: protein kinase [Planctomycetes bacterium]|nr:protein kinase [Planctomycetota bacterium]